MPAAVAVHWWLGRSGAGPVAWEPPTTFILAGLAVVPLAGIMGRATEHLAIRTGPTWGGLLNATFGNAAELIIGIVALTRGLNQVAKASLTGSILGNLLLVGGGAMVVGGWRREHQNFSRPAAETHAGLLIVAVTAMLLPAMFDFSFSHRDPRLASHEMSISIGTSVVLLIVYGLGLLFTLKTHRHVLAPIPNGGENPPHTFTVWPVKRSVLWLFIASVGVALFSELLVGSIEKAAAALQLNYLFVGVIVLAVIGNAAEHSSALMLARRNDMDTAMTIAFQSSLQIALFVTPVLVMLSGVLASLHVGQAQRMDMVFSPLEVVSVYMSVVLMVNLSRNGESTWFEGSLLLAVWAILAITFFYVPGTEAAKTPHLREPERGYVSEAVSWSIDTLSTGSLN